MKKVKIVGKLSLNKETITKLNSNELDAIKGGATIRATCPTTCYGTGEVCCSYTITPGCITG